MRLLIELHGLHSQLPQSINHCRHRLCLEYLFDEINDFAQHNFYEVLLFCIQILFGDG